MQRGGECLTACPPGTLHRQRRCRYSAGGNMKIINTAEPSIGPGLKLFD